MKTQKRIVLILIAILLIVLSACSGNIKTGNDDNSSNINNSNKSEKPKDDKKTITLKYNVQYTQPEHEWQSKYVSTEEFKKRIEDESNGRIKIDIYYSSQLVPGDQIMSSLDSGSIDMANTAIHQYGDRIPTGYAVNLPFWADGEDDALKLMNSEFGKIHEKDLEDHGVKNLFYWPTGQQILMSNKPINSMDDMKGMKLFIEGGLWSPWYKKIGVSRTAVDNSELYQALQLGTIDGAYYSIDTIETSKFYEVVDNITMPGILNPVLPGVYISMNKWNKIPNDLQEIIQKVSKELEKEAAEKSKKLVDRSVKFAKEHDVDVTTLSDEEFERFEEGTRPVWDKVSETNDDTKKMINILKTNQSK